MNVGLKSVINEISYLNKFHLNDLYNMKHIKHGAVNNTNLTDTISPLQIFSGEVTNIFTAASEKLSRYES